MYNFVLKHPILLPKQKEKGKNLHHLKFDSIWSRLDRVKKRKEKCTWVNDLQSIFALPMYICAPSTIHNLVCNTPPPIKRGKFTERTKAALRFCKISVSKFGWSCVGELCAILILSPFWVPAFKIDWKIFSPYYILFSKYYCNFN